MNRPFPDLPPGGLDSLGAVSIALDWIGSQGVRSHSNAIQFRESERQFHIPAGALNGKPHFRREQLWVLNHLVGLDRAVYRQPHPLSLL
jgi:hypothetical protein